MKFSPLARKIFPATAALIVASSVQCVRADAPAPQQGEWDGVTASARLDEPYENPLQARAQTAGLLSYYQQPWRSYMDTWDARQFNGSLAVNFNVSDKAAEATAQILSQAGVRQARVEFGWGNFDYEKETLLGDRRKQMIDTLRLLQRHNLRPLLLLNSHHAAPCPFRNLRVELTQDAKKGDKTFKVKDGSAIRVGYTGPMYGPEYCAAKPMITRVDADGTCHLSTGLGDDLKAGSQPLWELKYQPLHGPKRVGAKDDAENAMWAASAQATADGWVNYVAQTCEIAQEALGTKGKADAGFDLEVWNEITFGSNFLDINNYYDEKFNFEPLKYSHTRPMQAGFSPDATLDFHNEGYGTLFSRTCDYITARAAQYPGVKVDNGFLNQVPYGSGADSWDGQGAISRHFYVGNWTDISTKTARPDMGTIDAVGNLDGVKGPKDYYDIVPGTNFIPTFRAGLPEWGYTAFQIEKVISNLLPDARLGGSRYTHNGDFKGVELWQTEFNYGRAGMMDAIFKETKLPRTDPKMLALDDFIGGKFTLRSYLFQNHKGLKRLYMFAPADGPYNIGMFSPLYFAALEKSGGKITPEVSAQIPSVYKGLEWISKRMEAGEKLDAPRPLRVDELVEYKPRLVFAGDGTAKHPSRFNRDWFAFLPYQLAANRFLVPYYVVTPDASKIWQPAKDVLDKTRYVMPDQEFDVTVGNCAGAGAKVSAYDPLFNVSVPVKVVKATPTTLTLRLQTTDYPRVLEIEEAKVGPQILEPKITSDASGTLSLSWKTNVPVGGAKVTYGKDWTNRGAQEVALAGGKSAYSVKIPTGQKGVLSARIKVAANGLSDVWPRWDQDFGGQVVVPGSTVGDLKPAALIATAEGNIPATPILFAAPNGAALPVVERDAVRGFELRLPKGTALSGAPDDREGSIGSGANALRLRVRFFAGGAGNAAGQLPFAAVGDVVSKKLVSLPSGLGATLASYKFLYEAHPGMTNLGQQFLLVPVGADPKNRNDLLILSVSGTPAALEANSSTLNAIFAGVSIPAKP